MTEPENGGSARLGVLKTHKLFIGGKFPRTESGRTMEIRTTGEAAHVCRASRKDLRTAVEAAGKAQPGWSNATAYLRGQILYRVAEMMEGKRGELIDAVRGVGEGAEAEAAREVDASIDRVVSYAGWCDKHQQVLGANNAVAGPYYCFTSPEPIGVVGVIAPDKSPLLGLVSLMLPALCAGNAVVALGSSANPIPTSVLGEVCAISDVPAGVVNLLTGERDELVPHVAEHRGIGAVHASGVDEVQSEALRGGSADNLKRVTVRTGVDWYDPACASPWWIEPLVDFKTVWHPSAT